MFSHKLCKQHSHNLIVFPRIDLVIIVDIVLPNIYVYIDVTSYYTYDVVGLSLLTLRFNYTLNLHVLQNSYYSYPNVSALFEELTTFHVTSTTNSFTWTS